MKFKVAELLVAIVLITGTSYMENNLKSDEIENNELDWEWVVRPEDYENCFILDEGRIAVKESDGKYRVIDEEGKHVFSDGYDEIQRYYEGIACVCDNGESFFIDENGKRITDDVYQDVKSFHECKGVVKLNGLWGYIGPNGEIVIDCQFEDARLFYEDRAAVMTGGKWGFIDSNGAVVVSCRYDEVRDFKEGYAAVRRGDSWGFVSEVGQQTVECQYDEVYDFREGMAAVMKGEKWGFINGDGQEAVPLEYDHTGNFSEGKAAVKMNDYWGQDKRDAWAYIDKKGEIVIDFYPYYGLEGRRGFAGEFQDGLAFVSYEFYSVIDENGDWVFDGHESSFFIDVCEYSTKYDAIPGYVYTDDFMREKKYGLVGLDGEQRLEPVFDYIHGIYGHYVLVSGRVGTDWRYGIIKILDS